LVGFDFFARAFVDDDVEALLDDDVEVALLEEADFNLGLELALEEDELLEDDEDDVWGQSLWPDRKCDSGTI
jgi:hypothetical protein